MNEKMGDDILNNIKQWQLVAEAEGVVQHHLHLSIVALHSKI